MYSNDDHVHNDDVYRVRSRPLNKGIHWVCKYGAGVLSSRGELR